MACFVQPKHLSIISALLIPLTITSGREELSLMNPIAESVEWGDLTVHLEYWMTAPPTDKKARELDKFNEARDGRIGAIVPK